jgi:hypothetical protein
MKHFPEQITACVVWGFIGLVGLQVIFINFKILALRIFRRQRRSFLPLGGGYLCAVAMVVLPFVHLAKYAWIPLAVDPGCLYALLALLLSWILRKRLNAGEAGRLAEE